MNISWQTRMILRRFLSREKKKKKETLVESNVYNCSTATKEEKKKKKNEDVKAVGNREQHRDPELGGNAVWR